MDGGVLTEYCLIDDETGDQVTAWGSVTAAADRSRQHTSQAGSIALLLGATLLGLAARRRGRAGS